MAPRALGRLLLAAAGARGLELRRGAGEEDGEPLKLQAELLDLDEHSKTWESMSKVEQLQMLQGCHYEVTGPQSGYYKGYVDPAKAFNLPALKMQDGSQGFHTTEANTQGSTTEWPCLLALASTWDEKLVDRVARAIGGEFNGKGANVMLGPSVNVHRSAWGGRNFELLSGEDPYLGSRLTRAFVKGVQSQGVMCAVKHFAFSEQETNRFFMSSEVDARTAWELYYPPFEAAVQANVGAFMCAHNRVNGTGSCHSKELLRRDLRGAMRFDGAVISDWGAAHGPGALVAGMDLEMPGRTLISPGVLNVTNLAKVKRSTLREAALHIRTAVQKVGLSTSGCTPPLCYPNLWMSQTSEGNRVIARDAAANAVTLLKNEDNVLPLDLDKVRTVGIIGSAAELAHKAEGLASYNGGGGPSKVFPDRADSILWAMKDRAKLADIKLRWVTGPNLQEIGKLKEVAKVDVLIVVGGATSTEFQDRQSLHMDDFADELIGVVGALKIPTVVVMQTPGAVLTAWRNLPHVKAVVNLFLGGEQSGLAVSGVLFGDVVPSGKLPIMFPATEADVVPLGKGEKVPYSEGLFTSYRSPTFKAAFPFGHGLTYTSFNFSQPKEVECAAVRCVAVSVSNVGARSGAEVAQAYIEHAAGTGEPGRVLRGFEKVWLEPGESREVKFAFTERDLSIYRPESGWELQRSVGVHVGPSSANTQGPVMLSIEHA